MIDDFSSKEIPDLQSTILNQKMIPTSLYLASGNAHKAVELSELLASEELSLSVKVPVGMPEVDECGDTFLKNAIIKANALQQVMPDEWILADDSGLEVEALEGAPGVHSARYAGENPF